MQPSGSRKKSEADKWGLTVKMLKNICSEKTAQKAQAFVEATQTARPDKRGQSSVWKKLESKSQGRRAGQIDERGKMKLKPREFPHLWERLKQPYQLKLAKGRRWSGEGAAESFKNALEDEISSFKAKR